MPPICAGATKSAAPVDCADSWAPVADAVEEPEVGAADPEAGVVVGEPEPEAEDPEALCRAG